MYLANLSTNPERYIKDSYKFFHRVLFDEPNNVYAANGLGIVCAEKGEFDVAREIITRVSEISSNPSPISYVSRIILSFLLYLYQLEQNSTHYINH